MRKTGKQSEKPKPKSGLKIIAEKKEILDLYENIETDNSLPIDKTDPRIARLGNIISSKILQYVPGSDANTILETVRKILEKTVLPEKDRAYYRIESEVEAFFKEIKGAYTSGHNTTFTNNLRKSIREAGGKFTKT